jgi:hypothetical protein
MTICRHRAYGNGAYVYERLRRLRKPNPVNAAANIANEAGSGTLATSIRSGPPFIPSANTEVDVPSFADQYSPEL